MKRAQLLLAAAALLATAGFAATLEDGFAGSTLGPTWAWANEDHCTAYVHNALVLNPQTGYRQAAIGTVRADYSWVAAGAPMSYEFTVGAWNIVTNSHVSARLFLVGNEAGPQPAAFSDYDKPHVLMGKLDRWQGTFYWNLFVKTRSPQANADADSTKLAWLEVGEAVEGCTFGVTLKASTARLWWTARDGKPKAADPVTVPSALFSDGATVYFGVKNDTGEPFGDDDVVRISRVRIGPETPAGR